MFNQAYLFLQKKDVGFHLILDLRYLNQIIKVLFFTLTQRMFSLRMLISVNQWHPARSTFFVLPLRDWHTSLKHFYLSSLPESLNSQCATLIHPVVV